MANDFWGSIAEWFKEKTSSPLYGVFLASYVVCNWKKFYVLFWEYGAPPSGTRLEFLTNNLSPFHGAGWWLYPSVLANWMSGLIAPVVITLLIIKYAPHLEKWAHNLHLDFYFERKKNSKKKEQDYEQFLSGHLKNIVLEKEKQVESAQSVESLTEQINTLLTQVAELQGQQEDLHKNPLEKEYTELIENGLEANLKLAISTIYKSRGKIEGDLFANIDPHTLSFLDSHDIIHIQGDTIGFTDKGKFFAKKLLEKTPLT